MENSKILIRNAAQIVTCHGDKARRGAEMSDLGVIEDGAVAMSDGVITHVGPTEEVLRNIHAEDYLEIRAENQAVLPGFVDSHTHFIFGGYREEEFSWRLRGDSYMSIMERGGGIVNTMKATRESDFDTLWDRGEERLDELFSMGVTTVEGKSGYGLDLQTELVQLRVMSDLNESHPMDVVSTFLGAHAVPPEFAGRTDDYVDYMIEEVLPAIRAEHTASLKCVSADHLLHVSDTGIKRLARAGVVATLLPLTAFSLNEPYAPARKMIDAGCAVALASDLNPGSCFSASIPMMIALACIYMKMTPEEAVTALTINGAAAVGRASEIGSISVGKRADVILLKYPSYKFLSYHVGMNLVDTVIKDGELYMMCLEWRYSGSFDRDGGPSDCWQKEICGSGRTNENDRYRGGFDP